MECERRYGNGNNSCIESKKICLRIRVSTGFLCWQLKTEDIIVYNVEFRMVKEEF